MRVDLPVFLAPILILSPSVPLSSWPSLRDGATALAGAVFYGPNAAPKPSNFLPPI